MMWQQGPALGLGSAPLRTEPSLGPAIGPRDLSLAGGGQPQGPRGDWFRPGAKCNAGKGRSRGPRRQVVILGDSALRVPWFLCFVFVFS